ncbi:TPA_asm: fimbrial biogenesis outer membrane usher protein [Salmonella enterica subsp. enterica serovar Javiana]|uniref:Fimbrial biogenesis outer membrane usher protein n=1 Tax=Salmonella enterica subsp. enterica serovar Javiana TaxID=363569 RepID=A0A736PCL6_SALET|nr:fimbrial biogenesis outer membrane usher protein [Salmonella enterica subsp. enterica serovar 9,12:-:1,5]EKR2051094.1 fimbrial biogenesis outer membrane usher protein [Salmonella enterica subsp. enterica serovar Javiana]HAE7705465.1 fimbrial biogenesis outer membrane usher protein [Salmonella enterica subsp. enterica serovar Javiana]
MGLCKRILTIPCFMVFNISLFSVELHAEDTTRYTFDNAVLMGNASLNDLRSFNAAGLLPGTYIVDIYINDSWRGRRELLFKKNKRGDLVSCYSGQFLKGLGVNPDKMNAALAAQPSHCGTIAEWDNSGKASEQLNAAQLELRIAIPQAYVDNIESNYVQPELWQPGIPAINFGYNADYYSSQQRGNERSSTDSAWLGMDIRTSAGGWLLEHFGSQSWDSKAGSHYANNRTTLKRPIVGWKSMFSAGKFYTDSQMFDSIAILGVGLESEDLMRPDSTLNWAPVIRGVAETNARVTITQDGQTIHQTSVPAGPFSIESVLPANTGDELLVTIQESDGRIRRFTVPYSTVPQLLKPGVSRYGVTVGAVDEDNYDKDPFAAQAFWQYGLNNYLTLYTGASGFERYQSALIGSGLNTELGAFAIDVTQSRLNLDDDRHQGQQYRLTWNRTLPWSETSIWLEAKFSSHHFYDQRDALDSLDAETSVNPYTSLREKQSLSASINQPLSDTWGSFYLSGSVKKYWDQQDNYRQYAVGYTNAWGNLTWSISAQRFWNEDERGSVTKDDQIMLSFSYFLPRDNAGFTQISSDSYSNNGKASNTRLGFTTSSDEENNIVWGLNTGYARGGDVEWGANGMVRTPYTTLNGTWSQSNSWHQVSGGMSGMLVGHAGGVTFSPERADTVALVHTPDAHGAHLDGVPGTRFDKNGYAIMPWLRPWRVNDVTIDPKGSAEGLTFTKTQSKVAPFEGNVVPVSFETTLRRQTIIYPRIKGQQKMPFGAVIRDRDNNHIGYVGQGGALYIDDTTSPEVFVSLEKGKCTIVLKSQEATCR